MKLSPVMFFALPLSLFVLACVSHEAVPQITSEIELGEKLFFEKALSRDTSISCASCHQPEFAFADNVQFSKGVFGRLGDRNTPSAMNQVDRNFYFWDGRAETLEEQALGPMENHVEMDFPLTLTVRRLAKDKLYGAAFANVYGAAPSQALLAQAIAAYENTLETSNSRFDRYVRDDDTIGFSASDRRGLSLFNGKAKCFDCHFGVDFTGSDQFKNIGLYNGKHLNDMGRFKITQKQSDLGRFKIPGLRNVAQTAPYMHNGMFKTLAEVIDYYDAPDKIVPDAINRDTSLRKPLGLTNQEKKDLENFLRSLSDDRFTKQKN